jgi:hypothetical protein
MTAASPTARGVDHVGITVPNLAEVMDYFVSVLGAPDPWRRDDGCHPAAGQSGRASSVSPGLGTRHRPRPGTASLRLTHPTSRGV